MAESAKFISNQGDFAFRLDEEHILEFNPQEPTEVKNHKVKRTRTFQGTNGQSITEEVEVEVDAIARCREFCPRRLSEVKDEDPKRKAKEEEPKHSFRKDDKK